MLARWEQTRLRLVEFAPIVSFQPDAAVLRAGGHFPRNVVLLKEIVGLTPLEANLPIARDQSMVPEYRFGQFVKCRGVVGLLPKMIY